MNLGDCVSGPLWPEETAQLLNELGWPIVHGNHDRGVLEGNFAPDNLTDKFAADCLTTKSTSWLKTLPAELWPDDEIHLCHGTPENDNC
ncbi:MAG: hypothetical protein HWE23_13800 [Rhodobacteraceae bacterium]|nr:hypothetical protein [Paracoccaceae bacterium]